ncbi:MAG: chloride channel protein [Myxococcales bacterium]|nr:chloride channel protein [Myxococcales bacterium]
MQQASESHSAPARLFRELYRSLHPRAHIGTILIAIVIGAVVGFASIGFRYLIDWVQWIYGAHGETVMPALGRLAWYWKILIPTAGGLLVGLLVDFVVTEAGGHGIPEVMESLTRSYGMIRGRVVWGKAIATALSVGSGGSVGREGPIVQVGAAIGSVLAQWLRVTPDRVRMMVGCGAAGAIAATFNAPIAGVLFTVEVILGHFAIPLFSPLVVSSVSATIVSRVFLGNHPAFKIPVYHLYNVWELPAYVVLSVGIGFLAILFLYAMRKASKFAKKLPIPHYLIPALGGLIVGSMAIAFPQIWGVGYDTVEKTLYGKEIWLLLIPLVFVKIAATTVTVASGASGGVFAPSLFIGAMAGGAFGGFLERVQWIPGVTAGSYALVGMAAMVAAATHAPLTMMVIVYEMTSEYSLILPIMIGTIISSLLVLRLYRFSVYTQKLADRGLDPDTLLEVGIMTNTRVEDLMRTDIPTIQESTPLNDVLKLTLTRRHHQYYVLDDLDQLRGVISIYALNEWIKKHPRNKKTRARNVMEPAPRTVQADETVAQCMSIFSATEHDELPVIDVIANRHVFVGIITEKDVVALYNREVLHQGSLGVKYVRRDEERVRQDFVTVAEDEAVELIPIVGWLEGRSLRQLELRKTYNVNVVAVKSYRPDGALDHSVPDPDMPLTHRDSLIVVGDKDDVERLNDDVKSGQRSEQRVHDDDEESVNVVVKLGTAEKP